ncbi:MAG: glycosyltransferase, partial [bacterium]
ITSGKYDVSNIMIYSSNIFYVLPIFLGIRIKHKIPVCFDVVEWYMPFQYKLGIFDLNFIDVAFCFNFIFPLSKNIIAISKLIQNHFTAKKCNILYLPAITDIDEITPLSINEKTDNKIRLIYPGNPGKKDALDIALEAVSLLNDEEKNRIEFHITGMSSNELSEYMQDKKDVLSKLSDCLVIHGKLPYDELMKLYNIVDFLALFRYDNRVTRANFPNKIPELFALGVSVITNKVGDYGECLNDMANSIIVDECSVESAMLGIRKVLALEQSELLIIKNNAKTTAAEYFDYRNWLQSFKMFLENTKV